MYAENDNFWIKKGENPPKMIIHPIFLALNGKFLNNKKLECAYKIQEGFNRKTIEVKKRKHISGREDSC